MAKRKYLVTVEFEVSARGPQDASQKLEDLLDSLLVDWQQGGGDEVKMNHGSDAILIKTNQQ